MGVGKLIVFSWEHPIVFVWTIFLIWIAVASEIIYSVHVAAAAVLGGVAAVEPSGAVVAFHGLCPLVGRVKGRRLKKGSESYHSRLGRLFVPAYGAIPKPFRRGITKSRQQTGEKTFCGHVAHGGQTPRRK